jgi:hypothetical protein
MSKDNKTTWVQVKKKSNGSTRFTFDKKDEKTKTSVQARICYDDGKKLNHGSWTPMLLPKYDGTYTVAFSQKDHEDVSYTVSTKSGETIITPAT